MATKAKTKVLNIDEDLHQKIKMKAVMRNESIKDFASRDLAEAVNEDTNLDKFRIKYGAVVDNTVVLIPDNREAEMLALKTAAKKRYIFRAAARFNLDPKSITIDGVTIND